MFSLGNLCPDRWHLLNILVNKQTVDNFDQYRTLKIDDVTYPDHVVPLHVGEWINTGINRVIGQLLFCGEPRGNSSVCCACVTV